MADKQSKKLNNLFFYGVSFADYDTVDISRDIITNIRMRFLLSGKSASNKLYRSAGDDNFVYSYNFTQGKPLQWRVVKNKHTIEEIEHLFSEKYCINYYDAKGHDVKKVFFDSKHRWFKTNYYNTVSNESLTCSLVPKEFDEGTSILKYMTGAVYPERLCSCPVPSCSEVRARVLDRIKTPVVTALTNIGIVYFIPEEDKEIYEKILHEEEERFALEKAPAVYVSAEEAKGGFNLNVEAFDMSKNLNRTFDISMAEEFFVEDGEVARTPEPEKIASHLLAEAKPEPEVVTFESVDDGSVDGAITDVVHKINSLTSLDINAEEILNIDVSGYALQEAQNDSHPDEVTVTLDDNDPAIDAQLRHIDSVLDGTALINSDSKLVIGDSVVDEDYISSIIDSIISSAFNTDEEVAVVNDDVVTDTVHESEVSEESQSLTDVNVTVHESFGSTDASQSESFDEIQDKANEEEDSDVTVDEISDMISEKAIELISKAVSENSVEEAFEEIPPENPEEASETAEISQNSNENTEPHIASTEAYIKENPADISIESRGEFYYYYGSVDENGKRSGRGRTLMSDGSIAYEGEYVDDKRKGQGSFYFKDGTLCYWGNWDNNIRSGFGVGVSSEDKAVHAGNWSDNKPAGLGIRFDSDGNLMFISSSCEDKKKGFTISDFSDTSFTVRAWSEKDEAFIQREISISDIIK